MKFSRIEVNFHVTPKMFFFFVRICFNFQTLNFVFITIFFAQKNSPNFEQNFFRYLVFDISFCYNFFPSVFSPLFHFGQCLLKTPNNYFLNLLTFKSKFCIR